MTLFRIFSPVRGSLGYEVGSTAEDALQASRDSHWVYPTRSDRHCNDWMTDLKATPISLANVGVSAKISDGKAALCERVLTKAKEDPEGWLASVAYDLFLGNMVLR